MVNLAHNDAQVPPPCRTTRAAAACLVNGLLLTVVGLGLLWSTPAVLINALILVIGLALVFLGLEIDEGRWLMPLFEQAKGVGDRLGVTPLQVLLLLDGLLLAFGAVSATGDEPMARSALHGWLWVAGIVLTSAGLWDRAERLHLDRRSVIPLTLAAGLLLVALALRLVRLDTIPFAVNGDEGSGALTGLEYLRQTRSSLFGTAWHSFPSFYFWLISLSQQWLGPTLLAARLPSAVGGTLAVLATFWAGTRLYGRVQGAAAALLLAGSHVHLMFSRVAVNNVWDSLFLVLAIGSVWVAWVQNARWAFLLTGVAVGLGQLFYPTGRLLVLAVPLWLVILAAIRPSAGRKSGVLSLALLTLVTVLPQAMYFAAYPNEFIAPLSGVAVSEISSLLAGSEGPSSISMGTLPAQFWSSALGLVVAPIRGIYHPSQPMLLPLGALLFCLGALLLLRDIRDPRSLLLLSALSGALLAGTLSVEAPNGHRMQGILPVLALIAARGPAWLVEQATRAPAPGLRRLALATALAGVAFVAAREARFFFYEAIPAGAYGDSATYASRSVSEFAADLPAGTALVLFGKPRLSFANFPSLDYLIRNRPICDGSWPLRPECQVSRDGAAFVFLHENRDTLPAIRAAYPSGQQMVFDEMPGNLPVLAWVVSE